MRQQQGLQYLPSFIWSISRIVKLVVNNCISKLVSHVHSNTVSLDFIINTIKKAKNYEHWHYRSTIGNSTKIKCKNENITVYNIKEFLKSEIQ